MGAGRNAMSEIWTDLVFSLNTILPVFVLVLVGYVMRRRGTVSEEFVSMSSNIVFYYAIPAKLFLDVATSDFTQLVNPRFILVTMGGTVGLFLVAWLVIHHSVKEEKVVAAAIHSSFRGNFVYVGMPIMGNLIPATYMTYSVLVLTFVTPLYNVLGVLIMSLYSGDHTHLRPGKLLLTLLKNPMILAVLAGVAYGLLGLPIPYIAEKSLSYLGTMVTPLALLTLGTSLVGHRVSMKGIAIKWTLFFKLIGGPLAMVGLGILLGMPADEIVAIYVLFAVPTAINVFIMTKSMDGDAVYASNAILTAMVWSIPIMTLGIYTLRVMGLV